VPSEDLPLSGEDMTVEHLLTHRSRIGDYLDEQDGYQVTDYVLTVPAHGLASTEAYLAVVGGHPAKFRAGERFCYWLHGHTSTVMLEGMDAGVSFRSAHDPESAATHTVISNSSYGAWPITRRPDEPLAG
jgi:hypothetical protein